MPRSCARILPCIVAALIIAAAPVGLRGGFAPAVALAQEGPTSPARYFPPPGYRPKEFTLVREGGWFHLFYLRENNIPNAPTQQSFGHAISRDLYLWAEQDTILPVVPGTFEGTQVWAPSLHRIGALWYLFYPGMRHEPPAYELAQTITSATSPDLYTWTRRGTPLFDNTIFPWAHVDPTSGTGSDCRDPFLWWDALHGEWLMYVAVRPAAQPLSMTIGIAGSTDLETWSDRGQMPLALPQVAFSDVAESPHVFSRDDSLLLILWTTDAGQSLTYGRSTDSVNGWNTSRRLRSMLGYSTAGWWGSEMVRDGERWYFGNVHNEWIDLWDAKWTAVDTFRLAPPDPLQLISVRFDPDRASPGDTVRFIVHAVNGAGRRLAPRFVRLESGWSAPVLAAELALPDTLDLTNDTTSFACVLPTAVDGRPFLLEAQATLGSTVRDTITFVPVEDTPTAPPLSDPVPTPVRAVFQHPGVIRFVRAAGAHFGAFRVEVSDVRGRRVWVGEAGGNSGALDWSTTGGDGRRVTAGVYFARVLWGAARDTRSSATLKVVVLH